MTIETNPAPTPGGGGNDSSGGSSSGGSSAPAAPPVDQYLTDQFKQDAVKRQRASDLAQVYEQIWGEPATESYIVKAVNQDLNVWEFALQERQKPAYIGSHDYRKRLDSWETLLGQLGVT